MKHVLLSCGILAGILAFCICNSLALGHQIQQTVSQLEQARQEVSEGAYETAGQTVLAASDQWDRHEFYFGTMLRHDELDEVVGSFAALQTYAACQDGDEFLSMCAQLIKRLEHIRAMEQPLPANIL